MRYYNSIQQFSGSFPFRKYSLRQRAIDFATSNGMNGEWSNSNNLLVEGTPVFLIFLKIALLGGSRGS